MSYQLITYGDAFVDVTVGPLTPVLLTGQIKGSIGEICIETSNATIMGGRIMNRRLNLAPSIERHGGGSSANAAFAAARLGARSGIITRVGNDEDGVFVASRLRESGVDVSRIIVDERTPTGVSTILLADDGSRASVTYPGACANLCPADVDASFIKKAKAVHVTNYYLLPGLIGAPMVEALRKIKRSDVIVSLDPGPIPLTYDETKVRSIISALKFVDIFQPTIDEAKCICGSHAPSDIAEKMLDWGVRTVVLKMGEKGSLIAHGRTQTRIPPLKIEKVVDTAGAGDIFAAALLTEHVAGIDLEDAARFASVAAALKIKRGEGRSGYPTRKEIEKEMKS